MARRFIAAIDQGTTSSRCIIFDEFGAVAGQAQREHRQHYPAPGLVEHDAEEIWRAVLAVCEEAMEAAGVQPQALAAVGLTNQRETAVLWDRATGRPLHHALVWQDTRTDGLARELGGAEGADRFRARCGLPLASYFSGPKWLWMLENIPGARARAEAGEVLAGTIDAWLAWKLTGAHVTDATNASRTMAMDLQTLDWDDGLLAAMRLPRAMLPKIVPSSGFVAEVRHGPFKGAPLAGILGDQQAALFGQACFAPGEGKCTYGTGNFLLVHTGTERVFSRHGLLTTVAYLREGGERAYALEGSVAVTGALVQWLRDNLQIVASASEIEALAASVPDAGGAVIVPAFSGLFAPLWRADARGVITGLTSFVTKAHLARAALEAAAWQTRDLVDAMAADGAPLMELRADGGMTSNALLMQIQADVLGRKVSRAAMRETTAQGAAFAAGLGAGVFSGFEELVALQGQAETWRPNWDDAAREAGLRRWRKAVDRALGWEEER